MEKDKWITVTELMEALRSDPGNEHQCCRGSGILRSTHWMRYDAERNMFADSTDWCEYEWYTEEEMLDYYSNGWWRIEH